MSSLTLTLSRNRVIHSPGSGQYSVYVLYLNRAGGYVQCIAPKQDWWYNWLCGGDGCDCSDWYIVGIFCRPAFGDPGELRIGLLHCGVMMNCDEIESAILWCAVLYYDYCVFLCWQLYTECTVGSHGSSINSYHQHLHSSQEPRYQFSSVLRLVSGQWCSVISGKRLN